MPHSDDDLPIAEIHWCVKREYCDRHWHRLDQRFRIRAPDLDPNRKLASSIYAHNSHRTINKQTNLKFQFYLIIIRLNMHNRKKYLSRWSRFTTFNKISHLIDGIKNVMQSFNVELHIDLWTCWEHMTILSPRKLQSIR